MASSIDPTLGGGTSAGVAVSKSELQTALTTAKTEIEALQAGAVLDTEFTAKGSLMSASAASTPVEVAVGSNDTGIRADSSQIGGWRWQSIKPTLQLFTSNGTWTKPSGCVAVVVEVVGGGGGGGDSGTSPPSVAATAGGSSSWSDGTYTLTSNGGSAGSPGSTGPYISCVTGGLASGGDINIRGGYGGIAADALRLGDAGVGGSSFWATEAISRNNAEPFFGVGYGNGGAGSGDRTVPEIGGGGGGGGYAMKVIDVTGISSATVTVGAGGAGGAGGKYNGEDGGQGIVVVWEYY